MYMNGSFLIGINFKENPDWLTFLANIEKNGLAYR